MKHGIRRRGSASVAHVMCVSLLALLARGCSSEPAATPPKVIRLAHNDWLAASVNDTIAKILLEEKLGYRVELMTVTTSQQWNHMATGEVHACLELWKRGHDVAIKRYIEEDKTIEDAGLLGPNAKEGFYFPSYLLTQHPELVSWQAYTTETGPATVFKTKDSGEKGRFLAGDPTWRSHHEQVIKNLGLQLVTEYAGSEDAELEALAAAYAKREPILMYFWLPHWAFTIYDLTSVQLPAYSPECYARAPQNGVDCDYPTERLSKIVWEGLKRYAPSADAFIRKFSYSTKTQIEIMGRVKVNGLTVEAAAREWIERNPAVWGEWLK